MENDVTVDEHARDIIEKNKVRIERSFPQEQSESSSLRLSFKKRGGEKSLEGRAVFHFPRKTIVTYGTDSELIHLIESLFEHLEEELKKYRDKLQSVGTYANRRPRVKKTLDTFVEQEKMDHRVRDQFLHFIEENINRFYNFTHHEVRSYIYQGILQPGEVAVADVLDEAIIACAEQAHAEFDRKQATQELYQRITGIISREAARFQRPEVSLERSLKVQDIDTDFQEYYQPDEIILTEDIIPDAKTAPPDAQLDYQTIEEQIHRALSFLPRRWREAFRLVEEEGLAAEEVASIQGRSSTQVQEDVEKAREYIRNKLQDIGLIWGP
jgi:RNA polymerase sigma factor (sigma-70 family)